MRQARALAFRPLWSRCSQVSRGGHVEQCKTCTRLDNGTYFLTHAVVTMGAQMGMPPFFVISAATKPIRRMLRSGTPWRISTQRKGARARYLRPEELLA